MGGEGDEGRGKGMGERDGVRGWGKGLMVVVGGRERERRREEEGREAGAQDDRASSTVTSASTETMMWTLTVWCVCVL